MADLNTALIYLMRWEDDGLTGRITQDDGGRTRFGIAERFHPEVSAFGFFDIPKIDALPIAYAIYRRCYWNVMLGNKIDSQALANKLLSLGVNLGMVRVIRWAQGCAGVNTDGEAGPETIAAWNAKSPEACLVSRAVIHYRGRVSAKPHLAVDLDGWLRRAQDS